MPETPPPGQDDDAPAVPASPPSPSPPSPYAPPDTTSGYPPPGTASPPLPAWGAPPAPAPAPARGTDGFAVAAFVLSLLAVVVVAVVLAVVALVRVRRSGEKGRGLAVAALAVSGAWVVLGVLVAALLLVAASGEEAGSTATPVPQRERVLVEDLAPGDCIEKEPEDGVVRRVTVVACELPHAVEAYAGFDLATGPYPGDRQIVADADEGCERRITEDVLDTTGADDFVYLYPSKEHWGDDRQVLCMLVFDTPRSGLSPR